MQSELTDSGHDWWLRPSDGCLVPLVLQSGENTQLLPETSKWSRLGTPSSRVSPLLRVSYWIGSSLFIRGTRKQDIRIRSIALTALKLVVALPLLCVLLCWTGNQHGALLHLTDTPGFHADLRYDTVRVPRLTDNGSSSHPYQPESARRRDESTGSASQDHTGPLPSEQLYTDNIRLGLAFPPSDLRRTVGSSTLLRPRYLCFVKDFDKGIYETVKVSDYLEQHGDDMDLEFVFVSYTRMQFRVATDVEIDKHNYSDEATREANREIARRDRKTLARWGIDSAKRVGKRAFWLDFECVRNDDGVARSTSSSEDVYRICDIVRAAHSMIIAIGPSASDKVAALIDGREIPEYRREEVTPWLRQWGSRLWTLPELLLCPAEYRIKLYVLGDPAEPKAIAKRNFAERAWDDAEAVKELVDHFEGSAILDELRLIEAALSCFSRRQTDQFSQGDIAYATMGLFPSRHRPQVNKEDSGFQAFAKLSLANDSGAFLSRLLCLAPRQGAPWHRIEDRWGVTLSDIYPISNVSGAVDSEAIILGGVYGATIHWDTIDAEPLFARSAKLITPWLVFVQMAVVVVPLMFLTTICLTTVIAASTGRWRSSKKAQELFLRVFSWTFPGIGLIAGIHCIVLIASRCRPQPPRKCRLLGMEGIVPASKVAEYLWGFDHGELTTVTPQSYSDTGDFEQPLTPPQRCSRQEEHAFTLVDTKMMTIAHFHCSRPPVAMFVCGSEGGMQRSLLCSYDWTTQTFHRQIVLRVARQGLDQLHLLDGIRLSLASHPDANINLPDDASESTPRSPSAQSGNDLEARVGKPDRKPPYSQGFCRTWKTELLFLVLCCAGFSALGPYFKYNYPGMLSRNLSLCGGLLSALVLLCYLPLAFVAMCTFAASSILEITSLSFLDGNTITIISLACEFAKGGFALALIKYMLSWYPTNELPLRFLFWSVFSTMMLDAKGSFGIVFLTRICIFALNIAALAVLLMTNFMDRIGDPKDITWLSPHQKLFYSTRATASKFQAVTWRRMWRDRQVVIKLIQPFSVFLISLLSSLSLQDPYAHVYVPYASEAGAAILIVLVGLAVYKFPSQLSSTVAVCSLLSGAAALIGMLGLESYLLLFPLHLVHQLYHVVPALLWAIVVRETQTWAEALGAVSLSLIGTVIGQAISFFISDKLKTMVVQLPLFLSQVTVWAALWAFKQRFGGTKLSEDNQGRQAHLWGEPQRTRYR